MDKENNSENGERRMDNEQRIRTTPAPPPGGLRRCRSSRRGRGCEAAVVCVPERRRGGGGSRRPHSDGAPERPTPIRPDAPSRKDEEKGGGPATPSPARRWKDPVGGLRTGRRGTPRAARRVRPSRCRRRARFPTRPTPHIEDGHELGSGAGRRGGGLARLALAKATGPRGRLSRRSSWPDLMWLEGSCGRLSWQDAAIGGNEFPTLARSKQ